MTALRPWCACCPGEFNRFVASRLPGRLRQVEVALRSLCERDRAAAVGPVVLAVHGPGKDRS